MQINSESGGFERLLRVLRDQACDHSRQDISRASRGHAWIARRIGPDGAIGGRDQGAMSLEHYDQLVLGREISRYIQAVGLNVGDAQTGQARHFSRVRSDDDGSSAAVQLVCRSLESV